MGQGRAGWSMRAGRCYALLGVALALSLLWTGAAQTSLLEFDAVENGPAITGRIPIPSGADGVRCGTRTLWGSWLSLLTKALPAVSLLSRETLANSQRQVPFSFRGRPLTSAEASALQRLFSDVLTGSRRRFAPRPSATSQCREMPFLRRLPARRSLSRSAPHDRLINNVAGVPQAGLRPPQVRGVPKRVQRGAQRHLHVPPGQEHEHADQGRHGPYWR